MKVFLIGLVCGLTLGCGKIAPQESATDSQTTVTAQRPMSPTSAAAAGSTVAEDSSVEDGANEGPLDDSEQDAGVDTANYRHMLLEKEQAPRRTIP